MLKNDIRDYQQKIIDVVMNEIHKGTEEIFIEMAPATGKTTIISKIAIQLNCNNILILESGKILEQQQKEILKHYNNIKVTSYYDSINDNGCFEYVIVDDAERISEEKYKIIREKFNNAILIFFFDTNQRLKGEEWLDKKTRHYSLSIQDVIDEGYINPYEVGEKFEIFVEKILKNLKVDNIEKEVALRKKTKAVRLDFVINNYDKKKIIIEVKSYRNQFVQNSIINQAVEQVQYYREIWEKEKGEDVETILIISCQVPNEVKEKYYDEKKILIIDISNLLYLTQNNDDLQRELIESIQYDISKITPELPIVPKLFQLRENKQTNETMDIIEKATDFIDRLEMLNYGKKEGYDKEYEKLCTEIIVFLFETEFTRILEQSCTEDKMFRMDLVCGLKGTSEFWKILMQHYNTRFIVFEFKNYAEELDQNLIYITEKYLYDATLRNVAILVSRKGFSKNAYKAAKGALTEHGKLIIDLKDSDLINMLRMKADGQDVSDYMLEKLEKYLMSISK